MFLRRLLQALFRFFRSLFGGRPPEHWGPSPRYPSRSKEQAEPPPALEEVETEVIDSRGVETAEEETGNEPPPPVATPDTDVRPRCSVYAPPAVTKGEDLFVQVWLHRKEAEAEVAALAQQFDEEAEVRQTKAFPIPLTKGNELWLDLSAAGLDITGNPKRTTWLGEAHQSVEFAVPVPADYAKKALLFTLRIFRNELPLLELIFQVKTTAEAEAPQPEEWLDVQGKRYRKAFVSYSSKDREEVLKRVQVFQVFDVDFFMDLMSIDPGDRWAQKLYERIRDADVFFLFWSANASASEWVLKEIEYALECKHGDDANPPLIQPILLEGPPFPSPPEQLGHLQFADPVLYFRAR